MHPEQHSTVSEPHRAENWELLSALRRALRAKGITYRQLAEQLAVSEATIKRMFREQDCTLSRLTQICGVLGISIYDLMAVAQQQEDSATELTPEQEAYLASHTGHFAFLLCLVQRQTPEMIQARLGLSDLSVFRYLRDLDRQGFIELGANNRYRLLTGPQVRWSLKGPLQQKLKEINQIFVGHVMDHNEQPGYVFQSSFRFMSNTTLNAFCEDLRQLSLKYRRHSAQEDALLPADALQGVKWTLCIAPFAPSGVLDIPELAG
ncbi:transcriptional regulator [Marinobacterium zhoushanense]|uniref:Transcriptional regulator n=1 Tax=Marinobacterium zhoushanense TaxID=1679163 RepID=A0ABQ1JVU8_9GAMM|nr:helix-turn-helix transcriptional regulator [Marinobacterium zhoushanense]GGB79414.1 transcriptional regulator [Marinobacterium zhoushanense]